jgi:hypothetical protein
LVPRFYIHVKEGGVLPQFLLLFFTTFGFRLFVYCLGCLLDVLEQVDMAKRLGAIASGSLRGRCISCSAVSLAELL